MKSQIIEIANGFESTYYLQYAKLCRSYDLSKGQKALLQSMVEKIKADWYAVLSSDEYRNETLRIRAEYEKTPVAQFLKTTNGMNGRQALIHQSKISA